MATWRKPLPSSLLICFLGVQPVRSTLVLLSRLKIRNILPVDRVVLRNGYKREAKGEGANLDQINLGTVPDQRFTSVPSSFISYQQAVAAQ